MDVVNNKLNSWNYDTTNSLQMGQVLIKLRQIVQMGPLPHLNDLPQSHERIKK